MRLVSRSEGDKAAARAREVILACGYPRARRAHVMAVAAFLLSLTACAHTSPSVSLNCLPMRVWSEDEKAALKLFYDSLPPGSVGRLAVEDLTKLRAENRAACKPPT